MKNMKLISTIIIIGIIILTSGNVKAAIQANVNTQYTTSKVVTDWIKEFRNMEKTNYGMGLNEKLNTDLTYDGDSNNIDVHMMKSTEYGAIAILSASGYGNPSNAQEITSTTGNNTGVMLNTKEFELVAGGNKGYSFKEVNERYYDAYHESNNLNSAKIGDALGSANSDNPGCAGWHGATESNWFTWGWNYFQRGKGGIFSYSYQNDSISSFGRGVAVCGNGV